MLKMYRSDPGAFSSGISLKLMSVYVLALSVAGF
jgi:hypothetical protein